MKIGLAFFAKKSDIVNISSNDRRKICVVLFVISAIVKLLIHVRQKVAILLEEECSSCNKRFTTYEVVEQLPLMVIKKDGRRVPFEREKLLSGIVKACEKGSV